MRIGTSYQLKKKITRGVKIFFDFFKFLFGVVAEGPKNEMERGKWAVGCYGEAQGSGLQGAE